MPLADSEQNLGVCFDVTGTLIELAEPVGAVYRRTALEFGVDLPAWRLEDAFARVVGGMPPRGCEGATRAERAEGERGWWAECVRQTFQATDSTVRFADFNAFSDRLFEAYRNPALWRIRDGAESALAALTDQGLPMVVTSNFDHRLPDLLQALELSQFFGALLTPSEVGARKPALGFFQAAAEQLGRPLKKLVYVGDDPADRLLAIEAHGIRVLRVSADSDFSEIQTQILRTATLRPSNPNGAAAHHE